jgi:hypothetical protein
LCIYVLIGLSNKEYKNNKTYHSTISLSPSLSFYLFFLSFDSTSLLSLLCLWSVILCICRYWGSVLSKDSTCILANAFSFSTYRILCKMNK